ncbi:hypothetical protein NUH88_19520 [Nisaea acidiphila]|uniref:Uncharacterized protein n=1 Tax=Nisaea acidiphila TaxID=1862145 RepID=A0A9J7AQA1_9PROT|nr:hypothetical protein [Nisaea acidiphila]UUX49576.1 hypothetical protein NUH88_19520 [Nisaea acidiphila]
MPRGTGDKPLVFVSHETPDGRRCVDLLQHADGSFGFEEYRRDPDDSRGWYAVGGTGGISFTGREEMLDAAKRNIAWLDDVLNSGD